jgi:hypothetical protein
LKGPGGAPTRATTLPEGAADRKKFPVASGVLDYFPDALVAISALSQKGNDQHNPGKPLHWDRSKSGDEADTMMRHFLQRGTVDTDGVRHTVKMAWRALALLQKELEGTQFTSKYPKYFITSSSVIYRARHSEDLGEYWFNGVWNVSGMLPAIEKFHTAREISKEKAAALGASVEL